MKYLLLLLLCLPITLAEFVSVRDRLLFDFEQDNRETPTESPQVEFGSGTSPTPADKDDFDEMWNGGEDSRRAVCSSPRLLSPSQRRRCDDWMDAPTPPEMDSDNTEIPEIPREDEEVTTQATQTSQPEEVIPASEETDIEVVQPTPPKPVCIKDKDCGYKKFCHRIYGRCENCMRERQYCRRRGMCCKGMECRYGVCSMPVKTGRLGSRCKADIDCDGDTCCAKTWGRNVCKPRLAKGTRCHPPAGGLLWSLHSHCPCQAGLVCFSKQEYATYTFFGITVYLPWKANVARCREFTANTTQPLPQ